MPVLLHLCVSLVLLTPPLVHAATLENPAAGSFYSGIGVISGWKCTAAGALTVRFNDGAPLPLAYGNERGDVRDAGACPRAQVGFVSIMNWAELGDGTHTAVAYDDGVEFARSTFTVATTGELFVTGAEGECRVPDFPAPGETMRFAWNEATQHLELVGDRRGGSGDNDDDEEGGGICDRTPEVRSQILTRLGLHDCENVTTAHLALVKHFGLVGSPPPSLLEPENYSDLLKWIDESPPLILKAGDFADLINLEELHLYFNHLTTFPPELFVGLTHLEVLNLQTNQLPTLPPELFAGLANLEALYLNGNQLTTLPSGLFAGLSNLKCLYLGGNQLTTLSPELFAGLANLEKLFLWHNQLTTLPSGLFADLANLTTLWLSQNQLTTLSPELFAGLVNLESLSVYGNPGYPFPGVTGIIGGDSSCR